MVKEAAENIVLVRSGEWMCGVGMCAVSGHLQQVTITPRPDLLLLQLDTTITLPDICLKIIFCARTDEIEPLIIA